MATTPAGGEMMALGQAMTDDDCSGDVHELAREIFEIMCETFAEEKWMIVGPWDKASRMWVTACTRAANLVHEQRRKRAGK